METMIKMSESLPPESVLELNSLSTPRAVHSHEPTFSKRQSIARAKKYCPSFFSNALRTADVVALLAAGFAGYFFRFGISSPILQSAHLFIYLSAIVTSVSLHLANAYKPRSIYSLSTQLGTLFVGGFGALFLILIFGFFSGTLREYSRIWLLTSMLLTVVMLLANRIAVISMARGALEKNQLTESVVIVGANEHAEKIINKVSQEPSLGINILGIFDDREYGRVPQSIQDQLLGTINSLLTYIRQNPVDRVVVALPWVASDRIDYLIKKLRTVPARVDLAPNNVIWQYSTINMERIAGIPVLTVANGRVNEQIGLIKRIEDLIISVLLLFLSFPFFVFIAVAIKLDSKGPVIFKQRRHGYNNQIFEVYKFRSMSFEACSSAELTQATRTDLRVTRVGRFLRRFSLDELPQLLNVLMGHMSIVGPRPHAVQHNVEYGSIICEYFARHNVKPGITGWAQVNGLRGEIDCPDKMRLRVDSDIHYIENWSIVLDLKIILMTAITVWFQNTAY